MLVLPDPVTTYLLSFLIEKRSLAYLLVNKNGCILAWGGKLSAYGVTNLQQGEKAGKQVFFLEGLLPLEGIPLLLPFVKTESGICADLHLFPSEQGDWVLMLDSTWDEMHIAIIQQQVNNSSLVQENLAKFNE